MANIEWIALQPSQIKYCGKIMRWKLRNTSTHTIIFGQKSPEKPHLGKSMQQLRVLLLCNSEILWVQLDVESWQFYREKYWQKSSEEFPQPTGKPWHNLPSENSTLWPSMLAFALHCTVQFGWRQPSDWSLMKFFLPSVGWEKASPAL